MPLRKKTGIPIPAGATITAAAAPTVASAVLDVPLIAQTQNQWCWAACTAMVARFLGLTEPRQCEAANALFGRTNCCQAPASSGCNRPAQYADVVKVYNHLGVTLIGPDAPLSPDTVVAELTAGRPFEVGFLWSGGGGHVVVVYGFTRDLVLVRDPWNGSLSLPYNNLYWAYGQGRWVVSYGRFTRS